MNFLQGSMKNAKPYVVGAVLTALGWAVLLEIVLRCSTFPSGGGATAPSKRWFAEYWNPINSLGYRDHEVVKDGRPHILFLGDSITAGQGVRFEETFYAGARKQLAANSSNIGKPGASTRNEAQNYTAFVETQRITPTVLVHQYFANDMEDYFSTPINIERGAVRRALASLSESELAGMLEVYLMRRSLVKEYMTKLGAAFTDPSTMEKHKADLARLHGDARKVGASVVFVVFPILVSEEGMKTSEIWYVTAMRRYFEETCRKGDYFLDVTPMARQLSDSERVVNFMDAHPSAELHRMVGEALGLILTNQQAARSINGVVRCSAD